MYELLSVPESIKEAGIHGTTIANTMPVITTPFQSIAIDIVSPLLWTTQGNKLILIIIDYGSCPDARPLQDHCRGCQNSLI